MIDYKEIIMDALMVTNKSSLGQNEFMAVQEGTTFKIMDKRGTALSEQFDGDPDSAEFQNQCWMYILNRIILNWLTQ